MKFPVIRFCLTAIFASVVFLPLGVRAATPTVDYIARLGGTPDGYNPKSAPAQGPDGSFYGTTVAGGPASSGTVYKVTPAGVLTTIYTFKDKGDGSDPAAGLVLGPDGNFYGTTPSIPGGQGVGTVFRVTPAGVLTTIHQFSALDANSVNADGADPESALLLGADGNFYGTTTHGGANASGTIYRITPEGVLTSLHSFTHTSTTDFYGPQTALVQDASGNFYGTVQQATPNDSYPFGDIINGAVFKMTPAGEVTLLHAFPGGTNGGQPSQLLLGADGNLYGLTSSINTVFEGIDFIPIADSTAFQITPDGTFTTLHDFTTDGSQFDFDLLPSPLTQGTDGNFYGTSTYAGPYAATSRSTVFRLTPTGTVTVLHTFPETGTDTTDSTKGAFPDGEYPFGVTQGADGNFYGVTRSGGGPANSSGLSTGGGTFFQLSPGGTLTTDFRFIQGGGENPKGALLQGADGTLYGTTPDGGAMNEGTIFRLALTGEVTIIHSFNNAVDGSAPVGKLIQGSDGTLYGMTAKSPTSTSGGIFSATTDGTVTPLYSFLGTPIGGPDGATPIGGLTTSASGTLLCGVTYEGGSTGGGTIFSFNVATGVETVLHSFTYGSLGEYYLESPDGISPNADLVANADGTMLYGTTARGGNTGFGTVFSVNLVTGEFLSLHSFGYKGADGLYDNAYPETGLALGADGNLYGSAASNAALYNGGGSTGNSSIFRITPTGALTTLRGFGYSDPAGPESALIQASDGKFYGKNSGSAFSFTPDGTYTTFGALDERALPFVQATDGNLYGVTSTGTASLVFRVTLNPATILAPPVISSATTAPGQVGIPFSYQITASSTPTSFTAPGLPAGLSLDVASGLISGTPTASGTSSVSLSATNSYGIGTATLSLVVTIPPVLAPAVTSATTATAQQGQAFTYQITASSTPTGFSASGFPVGVNTDAATGLVTGVPRESGTFTVTLNATNSGGTGTGTLTLTVAPALPVVTLSAAVPSVVVNDGQIGEFLLTLDRAPDADMQVAYTVKGSATPGVDYVTLKGTAEVKAGRMTKVIKVTPMGTLGGADKKAVTLLLAPGTGYAVGTTGKVKVRLYSNNGQ